MLKSRGVIFGLAAAAALSLILATGLAVSTGAATDAPGLPGGSFEWSPAPSDPSTDSDAGAPPASPVEPPSATDDDSGSRLGDSGAPAGLPDAGFGTGGDPDTGVSSVLVLALLGGAALMGAGATAAAAHKR